MTRPRSLGEALSAALDTGPSRSSLTAQRAQVLAALEKPAPSRRPYLVAAACTLLLTAVALLTPRWLGSEAEALQGAWQGKPLAEHARVVAPPGGGETLSFSDGSRVELGARAEIALSKLAPEQARLELTRGHVDAVIRKDTGRTWTVAAGPYAVRVIGTTFSVDWDAGSNFFAVKVSEGKVLVTGGTLRADGVLLQAGERFERQGPPPPDEPATAPNAPSEPAPASSLEPPRSAPSSTPSPEEDFRAQGRRGNYAAAMAAARRAGLDQLERELSAKDLLLLANTARYAGTSAEARAVLLKLRQRFPGSPGATHAALLLASQAEDRDRNLDEAERWLRVFLTESPRGELAAGARSRLLALLLKRGARAQAEQVAKDYLRLHPGGPHTAQARALVTGSP